MKLHVFDGLGKNMSLWYCFLYPLELKYYIILDISCQQKKNNISQMKYKHFRKRIETKNRVFPVGNSFFFRHKMIDVRYIDSCYAVLCSLSILQSF